jgi:desulfoferrodoxin (superoxide reductase-like protein)
MRYRKLLLVLGGLAFLTLLWCSQADANKSAVSIQAPTEAPRGSEVIIRVTVTHNDNNPLHYTEWVYVMVNGKEVARWTYSAFSRPESETFTKELKYQASDNLEIKAEASCNVHGSAGPAISRISVKD